MDLLFCYPNFMVDLKNDSIVFDTVSEIAELDFLSEDLLHQYCEKILFLNDIGEVKLYDILLDILHKKIKRLS
jgi:hypothetical protein